jgi:hypothetical protein
LALKSDRARKAVTGGAIVWRGSPGVAGRDRGTPARPDVRGEGAKTPRSQSGPRWHEWHGWHSGNSMPRPPAGETELMARARAEWQMPDTRWVVVTVKSRRKLVLWTGIVSMILNALSVIYWIGFEGRNFGAGFVGASLSINWWNRPLGRDAKGIFVISRPVYEADAPAVYWRPVISETSATVPIWPLSALLFIFVGILRTSRSRSKAICPTCEYDLRATPRVCPECGTNVDSRVSSDRIEG